MGQDWALTALSTGEQRRAESLLQNTGRMGMALEGPGAGETVLYQVSVSEKMVHQDT